MEDKEHKHMYMLWAVLIGLGTALFIGVLIPGWMFLATKDAKNSATHSVAIRQRTVLEKAANLRRTHNTAHIYMVTTNQYEVWITGSILPGKWQATVTEHRT